MSNNGYETCKEQSNDSLLQEKLEKMLMKFKKVAEESSFGIATTPNNDLFGEYISICGHKLKLIVRDDLPEGSIYFLSKDAFIELRGIK